MTTSNSEHSPLLGLAIEDDRHHNQYHAPKVIDGARRNVSWALVLSGVCVVATYLLLLTTPTNNNNNGTIPLHAEYEEAGRSFLSPFRSNALKSSSSSKSSSSPKYTKVQTLSFQIYTGGAPAFVVDESTGEEERNHECEGLHSYGRPETSEKLQCYLGLEDTAEDVKTRLTIMQDAVEKAYTISSKDDSALKIFLAPEFFFRGVNGAFGLLREEEEDEINGGCSDICQILRGLEMLVADKRFEDWLFLFGTVIASEVLDDDGNRVKNDDNADDDDDGFDYQFYNFAPLYKGFDPAKSKRIGKNFIVPKRYVSNADFLSPVRDLTNRSIVMELLEDKNHDHTDDQTVMNPHANGHHRYDNEMWAQYKDELSSWGYNMIEYGWFYMDGISFSVEICLDHLVQRALMTYMADVVTGSKTLVPSSSSSSSTVRGRDDRVEWVGLPKRMAQISLVSSAGMDVDVSSLALADGGHMFLQDGLTGNVEPHSTYGQDDCKPNEYEFFGGSQCVKRTAVISATDVTFEYKLNKAFKDYDLYPASGHRSWKKMLSGVFSSTAYQPKLTVYDPVDIALAS
mmetsp:Transcript_32859/g.60584  ORF Transcript_32859/g.60584 Transcript_32859/m.60584 type:complete len:570 (-) Transcript_32859:51-1760(-)